MYGRTLVDEEKGPGGGERRSYWSAAHVSDSVYFFFFSATHFRHVYNVHCPASSFGTCIVPGLYTFLRIYYWIWSRQRSGIRRYTGVLCARVSVFFVFLFGYQPALLTAFKEAAFDQGGFRLGFVRRLMKHTTLLKSQVSMSTFSNVSRAGVSRFCLTLSDPRVVPINFRSLAYG